MVRTSTKNGEEDALTVLHIAPTPFFSDRGCHVRIQGIVSALSGRSIRNIVCTYHHGRDVPGVETRRIPPIPGYTKREAGPSAFKYLADLLLFVKALAVAWNEQPDVIHGHLHEGALIGWLVKLGLFSGEPPLVFDVQGSLVGELTAHDYFEHRPGLKQVFRNIERFITRLPDSFVCSSEASARILRSDFGVDENRVTVVHDGADVTSASTRTERLREALGLPDNVPVVIYTGALLPAKGLESLKRIVLEAKGRAVPLHFLVVGYPEEEMRTFVQHHDLCGLCTVPGRVPFEELSDYLGLATVAVEPKGGDSGEASGKLLNYMGAGIPVVCFDTANNRGLLGEAGVFVEQGAIQSFVGAIERMLKYPDLCSEKGRRVRERVQDKFSWAASAKQVESVYAAQLDDTAGSLVRTAPDG